MAFKPVLVHASCVFDIAGFGEIGAVIIGAGHRSGGLN